MNHRKLIPANGIRNVAVRMPPPPASNHSAESPPPSGILRRTSTMTVENNTAKITPAKAAARGVVNERGPGPDDCGTGSCSHLSRDFDWLRPNPACRGQG